MKYKKVFFMGYVKDQLFVFFGVDYDIVIQMKSPEDLERWQFIHSCFASGLQTRKEIMETICKIRNL